MQTSNISFGCFGLIWLHCFIRDEKCLVLCPNNSSVNELYLAQPNNEKIWVINRSSRPVVNYMFLKFCKIHRKAPVPECLFKIKLQAALLKRTFCEILRTAFSKEHL